MKRKSISCQSTIDNPKLPDTAAPPAPGLRPQFGSQPKEVGQGLARILEVRTFECVVDRDTEGMAQLIRRQALCSNSNAFIANTDDYGALVAIVGCYGSGCSPEINWNNIP